MAKLLKTSQSNKEIFWCLGMLSDAFSSLSFFGFLQSVAYDFLPSQEMYGPFFVGLITEVGDSGSGGFTEI